jgi:hypothetical protein
VARNGSGVETFSLIGSTEASMSQGMSEAALSSPPDARDQLGNPEPARAHWPGPEDTEIAMSEATRREFYRALARLRGRSALRST